MRRTAAVATALAALAGVGPTTAFAESEAQLDRRLTREMRLIGANAGAYVRDLRTGEELYALREKRARIPASVTKLLTTSTLLLRDGQTHRLQTTALATGPVDAEGALAGDLVLVGQGDPFFGTERASELARAVRTAGIRRIDGAVVGDESLFDSRRSGRYSGYDRDVGGVLSALAYDRGFAGGRPQLAAGAFAAGRFAAQLRRAGVRVAGRSRAGVAPTGALAVASLPSPGARLLTRLVNVPSNNFAAEMVLKGLGARHGGAGTTPAGAAVVRATLRREAGVRLRVADGSGLSRANGVSPRDVVRLLDRMNDADIGTALRSSLAVAGRSGTLRKRMRGTSAARRCRAKTGTLRDVSALAGYCRTRGGRHVAFAVLSNRVDPAAAKRVEDRITAAIARLEGDEARAPAHAARAGTR